MDELKLITPLSQGLPKTGQETSVFDGDDGYYERGWWLGTLNDNNRTRFIEKEFVSGELVIMDLATNLMWPKDITGDATDSGANKSLTDAITWCEELIFGGFSDWHMPNILEMCSLMCGKCINPSAYTDVFDNWFGTYAFNTATLYPDTDVYCQAIDLLYGITITYGLVASTKHFLPVRSM